MADKKIFKPDNIMASSGRDGSFFDDLNLPPAAADFLQTWYRHLLATIAVIVVVILGWTFTKQFTTARADRASEQLTMAMQIENQAARAAALEEVASSYRRTGAGIWSRIEIAHLAREAGELEQAAQTYEELVGAIPRQDPRQPMVKLNLAQVLSELGRDERAAALYRELENTPGFEAWGLLGSAEILARRGDEAAAAEKYRQIAGMENVAVLLREQAELRLR